MPKSKRSKVGAYRAIANKLLSMCLWAVSDSEAYLDVTPVSLTKTKKRPGLARKEDLANKVQDALADYDSVWIFAVDNMRNEYLQDVRKEWRDRGGRIFFGRNKVIVRALGDTPESEAKDGLSELAPVRIWS